MHMTYRHMLSYHISEEFTIKKIDRDIKQMMHDMKKPLKLKPHSDIVSVRMERWWLTKRRPDGWICHVSGGGINVADWGLNQVQALRNAKALHKKLIKEKNERDYRLYRNS